MRSHRKVKTGLNLEYAVYYRCTAGIGVTGNQAIGIVDESFAIKAYVDHSRPHNSQYSELVLRHTFKRGLALLDSSRLPVLLAYITV